MRSFLDLQWTLPLSLAVLTASAAGCSSTYSDGFEDPVGYSGGDNANDGGVGGTGADGAGADEPGGTGGAADDGMGELPPEPDDEGVDNADEPEACDAETDVTLYLSPDDSNSMSSPVQVREAVLGGWGSVSAVAIRTWEFFNYYDFGYDAAEVGNLRVTPSLYQGPEDPADEYLLQIGVSSETVTAETRDPMAITLVLDTSGSMAGTPMDMLKESCRAIASSLRAGDTISMVTWSTSNAIVLGGYEVDGPDDATLLSKIDALEAGGGTDLHGGLVAGYDLAQQVWAAGQINRIVLVSDGGANAGITDIELIAEQAGTQGEDGIYMVGVGVGDATSYHDDLMDAVTDTGKGASVFIASADEAWSVFHDRFISTFDVAARDVQVRLDLPPGFEIVSTSAEEVSSDPSEVEPQHLAPNDTMVFHQRIRTCAPDLVTDETELTVTVRYLDALTFAPQEIALTSTFGALREGDQAPLLKGAAVFAYAEGLKAYKQAPPGEEGALSDAFAALERAELVLPEDPDLAEIRDVLEALLEP